MTVLFDQMFIFFVSVARDFGLTLYAGKFSVG
jgi:hypothetical protein